MLTISHRSSRSCDGVSRRSFLQVGALGGLGLGLPQWLARQASAHAKGASTADVNCILIWTQGGTSHHDTLDPKPEAPVSVKGEYDVINTAVPGVHFTEVCGNLAREANRFSILRSWNPKNGSHGIADQYVMTGNRFNPGMAYPTLGSVVSWNKGFKSEMPPFVQMGTSIDNRFGGGTSGILGLEHGPFVISADPAAKNFVVRDITPPAGVTADRVVRRRKVLSMVDSLQRSSSVQPASYTAIDEHYKAALDMVTAPATSKAFTLEEEGSKVREAYGMNKFGQSLLLSRRMIEAGVRFVTVTDGGWDTHQNNFKSLKDRLMPRVDQGLPQLVKDLEDRGMLDNTLVVWLTDFGRTPKINSASGRDHWADSGFVVMAGAGLPGGSVLGATDAEGGKPIDSEYFTEDVVATIYHKLGMDPELHAQSPDGRPVKLINGRTIREWV
ncbi:MAG: DUF1501 domain-containing protein [Planctomycetaceae bacterium]|nr:DUF1501 domain-containing protein [Planctomycetaceae bacterium]